MPVEEDIGKAYQNYYTHSDARLDHGQWMLQIFTAIKESYLAMKYGYHHQDNLPLWQKWIGCLIYLHPGRRTVMDFNVMWLPRKDPGRLLDVGCGSGQLLQFMQSLGWQVDGVDFDAKAAENAKSKGVQVHVGDLRAQGFSDDCFDAVTMSHFIEHVHDPISLLRECRRILKPGGQLVVVTPNTESLGHRIYRNKWMHLDPPRHLHLFNMPSLRSVAEKTDFAKLALATSIRDAYGMFLGSRSILRTGSYRMEELQPRTVRMWARGMELVEWLAVKLNPRLGEELVLIAEK